MKGSIRFLLGILIVFGGVGGLDADTATITEGLLISLVGLGIMYSGICAMNKEENL